MQVAVIVLAAGASTRMGSAKQLLLYRGRPLILHAVEQALASQVQKVFVVLGANAPAIATALTAFPQITLVENPNWEQGMGSSVRAGIQSAAAEFDAIILMLGDQPLISPAVVNQLITLHQQSAQPLVASRYAGSAGVPALFARQLFPQLLNLPPAAGCKRLIEAHASQSAYLDCPEGELDIDTPEDLARANRLER